MEQKPTKPPSRIAPVFKGAIIGVAAALIALAVAVPLWLTSSANKEATGIYFEFVFLVNL